MQSNKLSQIIKIVLIVIPLILGISGLCIAGTSFLDSVYFSLTMYLLNYTSPPPNILVEIARWTAPIATLSGVVMIIAIVSKRLKDGIKNYKYKDKSVGIYGADNGIDNLKDRHNKHIISIENDRVPQASKYILFSNENDNVNFYYRNMNKFKDKPVYIKCSNLRSQETNSHDFHLFNLEEIGARLFWKDSDIYKQFKNAGSLNISLIGDGLLAQKVLVQGLMCNIFDPKQRFIYHVFGDWRNFHDTYHQLSNIEDSVIFYDDDWRRNIETLNSSDRLIVCLNNTDISNIQDLLFATTVKNIDIVTDSKAIINIIDDNNNRIHIFDYIDKSCSFRNIMSDILLKRAKKINLRYAHLYNNVVENTDNLNKEWDKLDAFTKYSNISSADYHDIRKMMIGSKSLEDLLPDELELLSELEHIRWCRYHYINNWKYGIPKNGARKDGTLKIHKDLVAYDSLTEEEKEKDRENIRVLMNIDNL